jgi:transposase-like protein
MSKAQLVITAVVLEGRSKSEVARDYDLSRQWVHQLVRRYHADVRGTAPRHRPAFPAVVGHRPGRRRPKLNYCLCT